MNLPSTSRNFIRVICHWITVCRHYGLSIEIWSPKWFLIVWSHSYEAASSGLELVDMHNRYLSLGNRTHRMSVSPKILQPNFVDWFPEKYWLSFYSFIYRKDFSIFSQFKTGYSRQNEGPGNYLSRITASRICLFYHIQCWCFRLPQFCDFSGDWVIRLGFVILPTNEGRKLVIPNTWSMVVRWTKRLSPRRWEFWIPDPPVTLAANGNSVSPCSVPNLIYWNLTWFDAGPKFRNQGYQLRAFQVVGPSCCGARSFQYTYVWSMP